VQQKRGDKVCRAIHLEGWTSPGGGSHPQTVVASVTEGGEGMNAKLIVLGLDGATYTLLQPWMEAGHLPHLRKIVDTGVSGMLESSIPPVTSPAWPCFMTGKNPGKHGVAWFRGKRSNSYEEIPLDSTSIDSKTLWEILSEGGRKVAVLNVPVTYPIRPVNGVMISGFLMPPGKRDFVYPPELLDELEERFGHYQTDLKTPLLTLVNQTPAAIEKVLQEARELLDYKCSVAEYIMEKDEFDFFMLHIIETDRIQHWFWNLLDSTHPHYQREIAERCHGMILEYYRALDSRIGTIAAKAGPEATIIIMSDHGFGPCHKGIDLNAWLLHEGYLKIKSDPVSQIKFSMWKMGWNPGAFFSFSKRLLKMKSIQKLLMKARARGGGARSPLQFNRESAPLFLSMRDIDWARSRAYSLSGSGQIWVNVTGREPQGIVRPGEEYQRLRDEIIEKLKGLVHPDTGERVDARVFAKEEIYRGKHLGDLPDIIFLPEENKYMLSSRMTFIGPRIFVEDMAFRGYHRMDGILMIIGATIRRRVRIEGAHIMDLAPTILYLMGRKIPDDMDGRVLSEIFEEEFLKNNAIEFVDQQDHEEVGSPVMSEEDERSVVERLKGLGYIS
jgi:predicted AlkP superfamily phosphohydrolase/phosphomutase